MLLIIDNGIGSTLIAKLINLSLVSSTDSKPVLVGIVTDLLALIKESGQATEDVAAEVGGKLLVQIDVITVLLQAIDIGCFGGLAGIPLRCVRAVGGPCRRWDG